MAEQTASQRDWLGHGLQLVGVLAFIGVPLLLWGNNVNSAVATMSGAVARQEKDIAEARQVQTIVAGQMMEINRQLTKIDTLVGEMREGKKR